MKSINKKKLNKSDLVQKFIILFASIILIYLLISLYFKNHFFFHTVINGVNVSLKAHNDSDQIIKMHINNYELLLIEKNGETEIITGQNIGMQYNDKNSITQVYRMQNSLKWINSLFNSQEYYVKDLYVFNNGYLCSNIYKLKCIKSNNQIKSQNVKFKYSNGTYEVVKEEYGNKIIIEKLYNTIKINILKGKKKLDLDETDCYEKPKYTLNSDKTYKTKTLLKKYVLTKITYKFGDESIILDGKIINEWLSVDNKLEVVINKIAISNYIKGLSKRYDTVGVTRNFKTSVGKTVEIKGGLYGWKINQEAESKALLENIKQGEVIEKEPIYTQKALSRLQNEIGNTYVEINITRQHVWFYKDGKLIIQGSVVTGNPNRGYATVIGTYMLNYKQKGVILKGPGYEVEVTYWMPFYGNIGLHDASWRYAFGGEIYKTKGTHGCVNAPFYLAKTIYENIEEGIPIICYEE